MSPGSLLQVCGTAGPGLGYTALPEYITSGKFHTIQNYNLNSASVWLKPNKTLTVLFTQFCITEAQVPTVWAFRPDHSQG
jgi:hypothetical protein